MNRAYTTMSLSRNARFFVNSVARSRAFLLHPKGGIYRRFSAQFTEV